MTFSENIQVWTPLDWLVLPILAQPEPQPTRFLPPLGPWGAGPEDLSPPLLGVGVP